MTENKAAMPVPKDGRRATMDRSWRDVAASTPPVWQAPLEWDATQMVILWPMDES